MKKKFDQKRFWGQKMLIKKNLTQKKWLLKKNVQGQKSLTKKKFWWGKNVENKKFDRRNFAGKKIEPNFFFQETKFDGHIYNRRNTALYK